jgi:hypothetical protein
VILSGRIKVHRRRGGGSRGGVGTGEPPFSLCGWVGGGGSGKDRSSTYLRFESSTSAASHVEGLVKSFTSKASSSRDLGATGATGVGPLDGNIRTQVWGKSISSTHRPGAIIILPKAITPAQAHTTHTHAATGGPCSCCVRCSAITPWLGTTIDGSTCYFN